MTVSADVKLIPKPPARVDKRKIEDLDVLELKLSMIFYLSIVFI